MNLDSEVTDRQMGRQTDRQTDRLFQLKTQQLQRNTSLQTDWQLRQGEEQNGKRKILKNADTTDTKYWQESM